VSRLLTTFDDALGILVLTVENELSSISVIEYYHNLALNRDYPRDLKVLCFITATNYPVKPEDVIAMVGSLKEACSKYTRLTEAFVAEDPYATVITTLFSKKAKIPNYRSKVFSTKEAALKWLLK
jgi:hypothetical protein